MLETELTVEDLDEFAAGDVRRWAEFDLAFRGRGGPDTTHG